MRKGSNKNGKGPGKVVAKENLPSKVCVVCHRPFTWRKKWERNWNEVTTCSKSCNAKRRAMNKQQQQDEETWNDTAQPAGPSSISSSHRGDDDASVTSSGSNTSGEHSHDDTKMTKEMMRKQHKEAVKAQKRERRAKREGKAPELGRKPCDLCQREVDLLVRCTVDESQQFKMVCGKCWPSVSGGVPDGTPNHPHYTYGGLWKNRNANLKKRVGSGPKSCNTGAPSGEDDGIIQLLDEASLNEDGSAST